jgi:multidrug resistance efflux pump
MSSRNISHSPRSLGLRRFKTELQKVKKNKVKIEAKLKKTKKTLEEKKFEINFLKTRLKRLYGSGTDEIGTLELSALKADLKYRMAEINLQQAINKAKEAQIALQKAINQSKEAEIVLLKANNVKLSIELNNIKATNDINKIVRSLLQVERSTGPP